MGTSEQAILARLRKLGSPGMSVLEVGGGIGDLQVALLEDGVAATTINVELSSTWESAAADLLRSRYLTDKVTRLNGDFVDVAGDLPTVDAVILHRVVCCYHDWRRLLGTAAAKAEQILALTFPRPWTKALLALENLYQRLRRRQFRAYVHPPEEMLAMLSASGFTLISDHRTAFWRTGVLARARAA